MPLIGTKELFKKAYTGGYAIGAFNVNNMEIIQGIVEAAEEENAPLILQISKGARNYARHEYLMGLIEVALKISDLPIAVHLDHGDSFELCKSCIDGGFTSVMIDGSHLPFDENVALTKKVVEYAHPRGIPVEAELGKLAGVEEHVSVAEKDAVFTNPDEAVEFVEQSRCDSLAVAIGTSHGAYKFKGTPKLDFERLHKIEEKLPNFPLVLHGASTVIPEFVAECNKYGGNIPGAKGVPEGMITEAVKTGVCKVNIDTDLRLAMTAKIRKEFAENPSNFDPRNYLGPARTAIKEMVKRKLHVLGVAGKA
jgi:fructose-bisphosphate aldolase class II